MTFAWRCWALLSRGPGILASMLDPHPYVIEWQPGPGWQPPAACAFHDHPAPDDGPGCSRCGWRGQPDLAELIWWLADFKRMTPHVIGGVELGGTILRGDHAHPEIPGILRAERTRVTGPLIVAPDLGTDGHVQALAARYGCDVRLSSAGSGHPISWLRSAAADIAAIMADHPGQHDAQAADQGR